MLYIYNLIVKPIELVVELVFVLLYRFLGNPGLAIIGVSLIVNIVVLPIYKRADAAQEEEQKKQEKMAPYLAMIRKAFTKDERYMMTTAYYKEVDYRPVYAFRGVLPILLQIPFFVAAYHFLSHLQILEGASFGILKDLSQPDGLFVSGWTEINGSTVADFRVNLLPILMTLINIISGAIYLRGFPLKNKIQTYGLALIFLVLLYNSPSGLVFYWTLNNLFSLGKNIVMKLLDHKDHEKKRKEVAGKEKKYPLSEIIPVQLCLTLLLGTVISSELVVSSPGEYVMVRDYHHPIHYVFGTLCISAGFFLVWLTVFYLLGDQRFRRIMSLILQAGVFAAMTSYFFFAKNQGTISPDFLYANGRLYFSTTEKILNLLVILIVLMIVVTIWLKKRRWLHSLIYIVTASMFVISVKNCLQIYQAIKEMDFAIEEQRDVNEPIFRLSTSGTNVMVICLDGAMGLYIPYIMHERPDLKERLDGFVFYPNTVSFGIFTAEGSQGVWGGYEYVPSISDLDTTKTQERKRYEADTMMARLFAEEGYEVTACDIPFAGYQTVSDPTAFDGIEGVTAMNTMGYYTEGLENYETNRQRAFFLYSIMKCMPVIGQSTIYDAGRYYSSEGLLKMSGGQNHYFEAVAVLNHLSTLTRITDEQVKTLLLLNNDTAHEPIRLRVPEYDRDVNVLELLPEDNIQYRYDDEGNRITLDNDRCFYHSNMAAYLLLADYFDYLKESGVYDNTRIIIVADHGKYTDEFPELTFPDPYGLCGEEDTDNHNNITQLQPVLMVKDINAHGELATDYTFMTNADTPTLATSGIIGHPINPYTGKEINSNEKYAHDQVISFPGNIALPDPDQVQYGGSRVTWVTVHDNIFDMNNWGWIKGYSNEIIRPETNEGR